MTRAAYTSVLVLTIEHPRQVVEHFWFNHLTTSCCLNSIQTPSEHAVGTLFERMLITCVWRAVASKPFLSDFERFRAILSLPAVAKSVPTPLQHGVGTLCANTS